MAAFVAQTAPSWPSPAVASGPSLRLVAVPAQGQGPSREDGSGPRAGASSALLGALRAAPVLGAIHLLAPKSRRRLGRSVQLRAAAAESSGASGAADVLAFDVTKEVGVCAPLGKPGEYVWDPFGETRDMDEDKFRWYRQAELKHGRVSMLAIAGLLNQHYWRFQGLQLQGYDGGLGVGKLDLSDLPNGFRALTEGAGPYLGVLVLLAGLIELQASDEGREPGNFGDPAYIMTNRDSDLYDADWRNFELNHGRLAMFGIIGALAAEYATGLDTFEQWQAVLRR